MTRRVSSGGAASIVSRSWPLIPNTAKCAGTAPVSGELRILAIGSDIGRSTPDSVSRNREQQKTRDRKRRLLDLANNNSALDLKHAAAGAWLLNAPGVNLANNNSVPAQVWVIEPLPPRKGPSWESCKQQPAGLVAGFAG